MGHYNEYKTRRRIIGKIKPGVMEYLDIKGDYRSIAIKKEFQRRTIIKQRIRDGDY